jgi:hypothetical protein
VAGAGAVARGPAGAATDSCGHAERASRPTSC